MTAKPVSVSVAADRQSRADLGSIYGQLLDKKSTSLACLFLINIFCAPEPNYPTLTLRRGGPPLPQSPIYLSCSRSRVGGSFVSANINFPSSRYLQFVTTCTVLRFCVAKLRCLRCYKIEIGPSMTSI